MSKTPITSPGWGRGIYYSAFNLGMAIGVVYYALDGTKAEVFLAWLGFQIIDRANGLRETLRQR